MSLHRRIAVGLQVVRTLFRVAVAAGVLGAVLGGGTATAGADSTLRFHAGVTLRVRDRACPVPTFAVNCNEMSGETVVPGLGLVSFDFALAIDQSDPTGCAVFEVTSGGLSTSKGTLAFSGAGACRPWTEGAPGSLEFRIDSGGGAFAGATGAGSVDFAAGNLGGGTVRARWAGAVDAPSYTFDTTKPVFSGIESRDVTIRRGKAARVRYRVTAVDARDGTIPVACTPRSGALFHLGRTAVACSATDTSGNTANARFLVIVHRAR